MKHMLQKIFTISQLEESEFGQPWPRHGLKLLYWFAKDCIWISDNDEMFLACNPEKKDFGFHLFENRYTRNKEKLLPEMEFPYYMLGNLNSPGADMLPSYIKEHNTSRKNSNADRIIVTFQGNRRFGKIYMTTHVDQSSFDPYATFHVSRSLLKTINSFQNLEEFLQTLGYQEPQTLGYQEPQTLGYQEPELRMLKFEITETNPAAYHISADTDTPSRNGLCSCTIL